MIRVQIGALHEVEAEAILRPVASDFAPVTGAGRDVEMRSGEGVRDRLVALGGLPVGGAVVTPGGDLAVPFLIHVVVQSPEEPVTRGGVRKALVNGLRRASEWEMETLAMPPVGTGAGNLEPETSARVMLPVLTEHMETHDFPRGVILTVPNEYEEEVFRGAVERARRSDEGADAPSLVDEPASAGEGESASEVAT